MKAALTWIIGIVAIFVAVYFLLTIEQERIHDASTTITIGFIGPLTGDAALYGGPEQNTVALAVEEINNTGGVNGKLLEIVYEDGQCEGRAATRAAQKLTTDKNIEVIIGGFCSSESVSAEPIATAAEVLLVSPGSSSPDLTDVSPFFVRTYPSDASQGTVLANLAHERNWRTVAFMQEQLDYPLGIFKAFKNRFEELGGVVVSEEFQTSNTDFRAALARLQATRSDALFIDTQTAVSAGRILDQFRTLDWNVPLLLSDAPAADAVFTTKYADLLEGAVTAVVSVNENNPAFQHLKTEYEVRHGALPYAHYMQSVYDTVYLLADGIQEVGYDAEKLSEWMRDVKDWEGASGMLDIGANGDRLGGHQPKKILDGELHYLE